VSDHDPDEDLNVQNNEFAGGVDQEQLTAEEKEAQIIKNLNSNNPQAPHNLCQFSFKERAYKVEQNADHLVFHINIDGHIIQKESDDHQDQQAYQEHKAKNDKMLLAKMNAEISKMEGGDPRKYRTFTN